MDQVRRRVQQDTLGQRGHNNDPLYNSGDLESLVSTYAEDAVEITRGGTYQGRAAIAERLRVQRIAFPDERLKPLTWARTAAGWWSNRPGPERKPGPFPLPDGT